MPTRLNTFIACRPRKRCLTRYTSAKAPSPKKRSTSYVSRTVWPSSSKRITRECSPNRNETPCNQQSLQIFPLCEEFAFQLKSVAKRQEPRVYTRFRFLTMIDKKRFRVFSTSRIGDRKSVV